MTAGALAESLGVSQPTLSRWMASLGPAIERIGAARATQYALRRRIRNLGSEWPVYRLGESGQASQWGTLRALHGGFRFVTAGDSPAWLSAEYPRGFFSGLPFFLQDIRPQGYHGRAIARAVSPSLNVSVDPRAWSDDDLVAYLLGEGCDLPGNLILGDRALEQALRRTPASDVIPEDERVALYPLRADAAQRGEAVGASAGGEQPKFLSTVRRPDGALVSVIVKFSAAEPSPVRDRWADLLLCEHLAAGVLNHHGISAARTLICEGGGRRFLEVERFDRFNAVGRRGLLTLGAIEDAFLDETPADPAWATVANQLNSAGLIDTTNARELRWRWCFGDLIANTDMHRSNTSLWFGDTFPFFLTPSYDMLPMQFAPGAQGELSERVFSPRPPLPGIQEVWQQAAQAAAEFWSAVISDERISSEFRAIARNAEATVGELRTRFN